MLQTAVPLLAFGVIALFPSLGKRVFSQDVSYEAISIIAAIESLKESWSSYDVYITIDESHLSAEGNPLRISTTQQRHVFDKSSRRLVVARLFKQEVFESTWDIKGNKRTYEKTEAGLYAATFDPITGIGTHREFPRHATSNPMSDSRGLLELGSMYDLTAIAFGQQPTIAKNSPRTGESLIVTKALHANSQLTELKSGDLAIAAKNNPIQVKIPDGRMVQFISPIRWVVDPLRWVPEKIDWSERFEWTGGVQDRVMRSEVYSWEQINGAFYPSTIKVERSGFDWSSGKSMPSVTLYDIEFRWIATGSSVNFSGAKGLLENERNVIAFLQSASDKQIQ